MQKTTQDRQILAHYWYWPQWDSLILMETRFLKKFKSVNLIFLKQLFIFYKIQSFGYLSSFVRCAYFSRCFGFWKFGAVFSYLKGRYMRYMHVHNNSGSLNDVPCISGIYLFFFFEHSRCEFGFRGKGWVGWNFVSHNRPSSKTFKENITFYKIFFRCIVSSESGNLIIWNRLLEQVIYKEERHGIRQVNINSFIFFSNCKSINIL